ncbi:MAG TPA: hypothetical protein VM574_02905 [Terrimicrobiaceae bacterium]|jgi:hypothetical protein|nr:hypothetical protein [Terrimicrobiaceae bacterium]
MNSRVVRTRLPVRVLAAAFLLGLFLIGFLVLAIWQSGSAIEKARMTGRVVAKEFIPASEQQVTIDRKGALSAGESSGEYILTVEVATDEKRTKKPYDVWVNKKRYEAVKIGDAFDVGPYLVRE